MKIYRNLRHYLSFQKAYFVLKYARGKDMKKLLVIVDMQNDFVDGALGFNSASSIIPYILSKIQEFKEEKQDIVYTLDTHYEDYLNTEEGKNLPILHCLKGSKGYELVPLLKDALKDELCFEKNTFGSSEFATFLKNKDYEEIILMGLVSNMCVLSNAIIAKTFSPNAHIVVDAKGSKSFDEELENKAYDVLNAIHIEIRR